MVRLRWLAHILKRRRQPSSILPSLGERRELRDVGCQNALVLGCARSVGSSGAISRDGGRSEERQICDLCYPSSKKSGSDDPIQYFPKGIDIYFDNVGGKMLDAALLNMRLHGRVALCGMVSLHSYTDTDGIHNLFTLVQKRIRMEGFLQSDYLHLFLNFVECVGNYHRQGKIVYLEDIKEGLENAPAAFAGLFTGKNVGKQVVCVAKD
ncbi:2-alkenal reductase (NADP(+)-dependent)-like [Dioscorea cayenensis subsp. rotundata]|uniref:2-alkenal reductase (NADP(+)-dependent)-like n=1 Tax=Dioscorea cayennensis subsp. rotundata TaxID=55577 RepID=A0AB40B4H5_DIOCR|nr:2-alkenal reductase (NADP(+)-dependent)-like [Dioscorea cayenensis subsp. rotundata]